MSFKTVSAILRGRWLIDKAWAQTHMPLVARLMKGEAVDLGTDRDETIEPKVLSHKAGVVYEVSYYTDLTRIPPGAIAMITMAGPITKYGDMCSYGSVDHVATLHRLNDAPHVKGIILNIDSPGGEASGTAMLADAIKNVARNKPVIAMVDDGIAASAAMWIASAALEIYVTQKTDMVGSVGVYTTIADWYGYLEKEGLKVRDIYAPQSTEKNLDYIEALAGNDELIKAELKVLADEFINTVKTNRAGRAKGDGWTTGKMFYTKDAIRQGLIDGQKTFNQVVNRMDALIKQKESTKNNSIMVFEKTLTAAKAESFEVVEGGFLLTEENLNNVEAAIALHSTEVANHATEIAGLNTKLEDQSLQAQQAVAELATANATIATKETEIATLNARITELESKTEDPKQTKKDADETAKKVSNEENPMNALADSLLGAPKTKQA
jgi:protease IV